LKVRNWLFLGTNNLLSVLIEAFEYKNRYVVGDCIYGYGSSWGYQNYFGDKLDYFAKCNEAG